MVSESQAELATALEDRDIADEQIAVAELAYRAVRGKWDAGADVEHHLWQATRARPHDPKPESEPTPQHGMRNLPEQLLTLTVTLILIGSMGCGTSQSSSAKPGSGGGSN